MKEALGSDWENFAISHAITPPVSIRLNPAKKFERPFTGSVPWSAYGKYLGERPVFTLDPLFHAGAYYVQEASSMFLEQALKQLADLTQPLRILDLSAAPGGKSTHLLSLISSGSLLVSNEVIRARASILSENIQKWGYPNCLVTNNDPSDFSNLTGFFDVILIDAPCSGEGLFRKDPDSMKEWSEENVLQCTARQKRILNDVWPALRQNGILIYSTCTYNEDENEKNLLAFAKDHDVSFESLSPDSGWNVIPVEMGKAIGYRFLPHKIPGEGFFLSAMRKQQNEKVPAVRIKNKLNVASPAITSRVKGWLKKNENEFIQHNDLLFFLPGGLVNGIEYLLQRLKFVYAGTNVASIRHDKLVPEHALALGIHLNQDRFGTIEADFDTAIAYLRRETIPLTGNKGYNLLKYKDLPLGWVNVLENRVNNMYPREWRIRMAQP